MEVWWSDGQVKLASVVLLVIISNEKQFQNLRHQDEQNNELIAWINLKSIQAYSARVHPLLWYITDHRQYLVNDVVDEA